MAAGGQANIQPIDMGTAFKYPADAGSSAFGPLIPTGQPTTSEAIQVDTTRDVILSPNEQNDFQIINAATGQVFNNVIPFATIPNVTDPEFDSVAEDCTTGIALAPIEGPMQVMLVDLTQAKFDTNGAGAGTWATGVCSVGNSAGVLPCAADADCANNCVPGACQPGSTAGTGCCSISGTACNMNSDCPSGSSGTCTNLYGGMNGYDFTNALQTLGAGVFGGGAASSDGSHLAVVASEFGSSSFVAMKLPASSGVGAPTLQDYVVANVPNTPDGNSFQMGFDPHTLGIYTSPNSGKSYAVFQDNTAYYGVSWLAVVDLSQLLALAHDPSTGLLTTPSQVTTCCAQASGSCPAPTSGCIVRWVHN
jgi:hypothetical protein